MLRISSILCSSVILGLLAGGCESTIQTGPRSSTHPDDTTNTLYRGEQPTAMAPAKAAPAPAAKPAMTGDGLVHSSMYFPTGERSGSVILMERTAPMEVVAGQEFSYDIKVTNLTSLTLKEVAVRDTCASNFTLVSSTPAAVGKCPDLSWPLGDLGPGESKTIHVTGKATGTGSVTSCATVSYNSLLCLTTNVVQPALKVDISAPAEALVCDAIPVKITVTNTGTGNVRSAKATYNLPAGLMTADGKNSVTLDAGMLAAGQTKEFVVSTKAAKPGTYASKAMADAEAGLKAESQAVSTAVHQPVLTIKAECPAGTVMIAREITFKYTVKNTGDAVANATTVMGPIASNATFVRADNGGAASGPSVAWAVGALKPGESKTLSYTVRSTGAGAVAASASATANCAAQVTDTCNATVQGVPDIGTLLTDDNGVVLVGDPHVFTYEIKNQGQVDLTSVKVVATIDDGLDFVSSTAPTAPAVDGKKLTFSLGTVKIGQKLSFTFTCKGNKAGEAFVSTETSAAEIKRPTRNDEQVQYVDR